MSSSRRQIGTVLFAGLLIFLCVVFGSAAQYSAFSLNVAQQRIEEAGDGWRDTEPDVFNIGGINRIQGFVHDTETGDLILVGTTEAGRAELTLDDLVVALRSRFVMGEWPLVSIDPTEGNDDGDMQQVRFEGGIRNTAFGQTLYDADYLLKQMGMGLVDPGVEGVKTAWERDIAGIGHMRGGQTAVRSRLWLRPSNYHVVVRDGVCVARGLSVGVFTEVLSAAIDGRPVEDLKDFKDKSNRAFASDVSERYDELCARHPSFNRLRGLQELVAVTKALQDLQQRPKLEYWLQDYDVRAVETPKQTKLLPGNMKVIEAGLRFPVAFV